MMHLLQVSDLSKAEIEVLIARALDFKQAKTYPTYPHISVINVFYEKSTRTHLSFALAQQNLGCKTLDLNPERSAEGKGEAMLDTLSTVHAMGVQIAVMRHAEDDIFDKILPQVPSTLSLINAGSGKRAHPTQALLDMMTIIELGLKPKDIKIAVVGDVLHSRVAHSFSTICSTMGVGELVFAAPEVWLPASMPYGQVTSEVKSALQDADIVMTLRVQKERMVDARHQGLDAYCITEDALNLASPNVHVLHPGPMNRGIEIDSAVADGPKSCILEQVTNGVYMRMAVLEHLIKASHAASA